MSTKAKFLNRAFVVVPMVLAVPDQHDAVVPHNMLINNAKAWERLPLVYDAHPQGYSELGFFGTTWLFDHTGRIGWCFNPAVINNKLYAEGWFDVELTAQADQSLLTRLSNDEPVELSLASHFATLTKHGRMTFKHMPDHIAICPNFGEAVYSIADGIGVNIV